MRFFIACAVITMFAGCEANNLYVAHNTVIGVNASVSPDRQQGQLLIGYDRDFVTVIPKSVDKTVKTGKKDVMALLNCTQVEVDGIFLSKYTDSIASGEAAILFARQLAQEQKPTTNLFDCRRLSAGTPEQEQGDAQ